MPPTLLTPSVLLALGLQGAHADTGDTGDTGTLSPCLSWSVRGACDDLTDKSAALVGLAVLGAAASRRRRRDLIDQLRADGVLPEDVGAQLADAETGEGAVDGQVDPGDVP